MPLLEYCVSEAESLVLDDVWRWPVSGKQRAELYGNGIGRVERALREGFWLEAITLHESLISA